MDTNGFYGDTFSSGFGDFYTARKRDVAQVYGVETPFSQAEKFYQSQPKLTGLTGWENSKYKVSQICPLDTVPLIMNLHFQRRMEMDTNGFYGDTFSSGFGDFYTAKRSKSLQNTRKSK